MSINKNRCEGFHKSNEGVYYNLYNIRQKAVIIPYCGLGKTDKETTELI